MAGDLAAKRSRADALREELQVLRVKQTVDAQDADAAVQEAKLDDEIVQLEKQVAIAREQAVSGGSVTEAMDAMALAAKIEKDNATGLDSAAVPIVTGTSVATEEAKGEEESSTEAAPVTETPGVPTSGLAMGLVTPTGGNA